MELCHTSELSRVKYKRQQPRSTSVHIGLDVTCWHYQNLRNSTLFMFAGARKQILLKNIKMNITDTIPLLVLITTTVIFRNFRYWCGNFKKIISMTHMGLLRTVVMFGLGL